MTLGTNEKEALIKYRTGRANETIVEAKQAYESGHLNLAVNRIYYACFYSAEALMLTRDFSTNNHGRLKGEFNKVFVHSGLINKKYFAILDTAFKDRQNGDYGDFVKFNKEAVKSSLGKAEEFVTVINNITLKNITSPD
ncbi:MAG: HEPN domain-containing protein [bacterium]